MKAGESKIHGRRMACFALLAFAFAPLAAGQPPAAGASPWEVLAALRAALVKAGPITARFEQTYVPAGFSSGDVEKGHFSLWLPDCLRWSYTQPQVKSFLLCKREAWAWNEEEEGGRHYQVEPEKELGLDRANCNVNGGAISLGHPLGATGTRLVLTLMYELRRNDLRYGVASACIGGGQGIAILIENPRA